MKRSVSIIAACTLIALVAGAFATNSLAKGAAMSAKAGSAAAIARAGTWKGEVLDAGCYLSDGAMGSKHAECALKCASNGMPLMLLVDGKAILLTPNHDNADPYNQLKTLAGSMVEVKGTLSERGGVRGIDVTGAKALAAR